MAAVIYVRLATAGLPLAIKCCWWIKPAVLLANQAGGLRELRGRSIGSDGLSDRSRSPVVGESSSLDAHAPTVGDPGPGVYLRNWLRRVFMAMAERIER